METSSEKKRASVLISILISVLSVIVLFFLVDIDLLYSIVAGLFAFLVMLSVTFTLVHISENRIFNPDVARGTGEIDDVDGNTKRYIWEHFRTEAIVVGGGGIILCIIIFIVLWGGPLLKEDPRIFILSFIPLVPLFMYFAHIKKRIQTVFMQQLATSIGATYVGKGDATTASGVTFKGGHDREMKDLMVGPSHGREMRIYEFSQTIGYGKHSHTYVSTVFEFVLHTNLSRVSLRPISITETSGDDSKEVILEGDFNRYFSLQITEGFDSEVRVIFQPDLMHELIEKFRHYRLEIVGDRFFIVADRIGNRKLFLETYTIAGDLAVRIIPLIESVGAKK